jgi:hypothetical protein
MVSFSSYFILVVHTSIANFSDESKIQLILLLELQQRLMVVQSG